MEYALDTIVALINRKEPLPTGFSKALQSVVALALNRGIYTLTVDELFSQLKLKLDPKDLIGRECYVPSDTLYKVVSVLDRVGICMVPPSVPSTLSIYSSIYLLKKPDLSLDQDVALIMHFAQNKERPSSYTNAQITSLQTAQVKLRNYNVLVRVFESLGAAQTSPLDANQRAVLNNFMTEMLLPHDGVRYLRSLYSYACDYGSFLYHYDNPKFVVRPLADKDQEEVIDIVARTIAPSHLRINVPEDFPWRALLESRYSDYCPRVFDIGGSDTSVKIPVNERPLSQLSLTQKRNRIKKQLAAVLNALNNISAEQNRRDFMLSQLPEGATLTPEMIAMLEESQELERASQAKLASMMSGSSMSVTAAADAVAAAATSKEASVVAGIDLKGFNRNTKLELLQARPGFSADFIRRVGELTALEDPSFVEDLELLQQQLLRDEQVRLTLPNFQQSTLQLYLPPQREGSVSTSAATVAADAAAASGEDSAVSASSSGSAGSSGSANGTARASGAGAAKDSKPGLDAQGYIDPTVFVPEDRNRGQKNGRGGQWQMPTVMGLNPFHVLVFTWERLNHLYHSYLLWAPDQGHLKPNINSDYGNNLLQFVQFPPKQMARLDRVNCFEFILRKMFASAQNACALTPDGHGDDVDYQHLFELECRNNFILLNGSPLPFLFYHSLYCFDKYLESPSTHFGNELFYIYLLEKEPYALNIYLSRICQKYGSRLVDIPEEFFSLIALNVLIFPQQVLAKTYLNLLKYIFKHSIRSSNLYKVVLVRLLAHRLYCLVHERKDLHELRLQLQPLSQGWIYGVASAQQATSVQHGAQGAQGTQGAQSFVDNSSMCCFGSSDPKTINQVYEATCKLLPEMMVQDKEMAAFVQRFVQEFCAHPVPFYQKLAPELLHYFPDSEKAITEVDHTSDETESAQDFVSLEEDSAQLDDRLDDRFGENLPRFKPAGARGDGTAPVNVQANSVGASYFLRRAQEEQQLPSGAKFGTGGAMATVSSGLAERDVLAGAGAAHEQSVAGQLQTATQGIKRLNANAKAQLLSVSGQNGHGSGNAHYALGEIVNTVKQQRAQVARNPSLMAILVEEARKNQISAGIWASLTEDESSAAQDAGSAAGQAGQAGQTGLGQADATSSAGTASVAPNSATGGQEQGRSPRALLDNLLGTSLIAALEALGGLKLLQQQAPLDLGNSEGYADERSVASQIEAQRQCLSAFYLNSLERSFGKSSPFADELLAPLYGTYVVPVLKRLLYKDQRYLYAFSQVLPLDEICAELQAKIEYDFIRDYYLDGVAYNQCIINSFIYGPKEERFIELRDFVLKADDAYHLGFTAGIKVEQMFELSLLLRRNLQVQIVPLFYPNTGEDNFACLRPQINHIRVLEIPEVFKQSPQEEYDNVLYSLYCAYVILELLHALLPVGNQDGLITLLVQEISNIHKMQRREDCVRFAYEYLECASQIIALEGPLKADQLLNDDLKLDAVLMGNRGIKRLKYFLTMAFSFELQHSFVSDMVSNYYNELLQRLHCFDEQGSENSSLMDKLYGNYTEGRTLGGRRMSRLELDMDKIKAKLKESEQVQKVITELREKEQAQEQQQEQGTVVQADATENATPVAGKTKSKAKAKSKAKSKSAAATAVTASEASAVTTTAESVSSGKQEAPRSSSAELKFIAGALQGAEAMAKREALHAQSQQGAIAEAQARAQNVDAYSTDEQGQVVSISTHPINSKLNAKAREIIETIAIQATDAMVYREFNGICVSHGMLSGNYCIELLNDYSFEVYDEPVLELDGEGDNAIVYITTEILQDMYKNCLNLKKG